jgi:hypothetical protein
MGFVEQVGMPCFVRERKGNISTATKEEIKRGASRLWHPVFKEKLKS